MGDFSSEIWGNFHLINTDRLWVALYPNYKRAAGVGKTPKEALEQAKNKKIKNPILIKAIPDYSRFQIF